MTLKLSLIIPCYNEEKTLPEIVEKTLQLKSHVDLELVIVNDCSSDNSLSVAKQLEKKYDCVKVFSHTINQGKGAALKTGFMHATGDVVGVQDADMEYDPMDYLKLLEPIQNNQADVVYGSRYLLQTTRRVLYFWHTMMNVFLTFCSNMFTNLHLTDMETCYKLFRREVLQKLAPHLREKRFGFEPEITTLVAKTHCRVWECAISYNPRTYNEGKKINYKDGLRALYCIMHYGTHIAALPMQIFLYTALGILCALLNVVLFSSLNAFLSVSVGALFAFLITAVVNYLIFVQIMLYPKEKRHSQNAVKFYASIIALIALLNASLAAGLMAINLNPFWAITWAALFSWLTGSFSLRKYLAFFARGE